MHRLDDILAFLRVVETRSFTAAAQRLGLSKSVVSRRVSELENRLGARLLNRTTRRLSVTEVGQAFYERCARVVADLEEAELAVASLQGELRGTLRVNAPVSFGTRHLAPALAEFQARHPELTVELDLADRYVDLVDEGYDVAIRIGRLRDSSLIARRLVPFRHVLCASPAYLARRGRPARPDDLHRHDCLVYTLVPQPGAWEFEVDGRPQAIRVAGHLRANNGDVLRAAAVAGQGLAYLPTFIIGDDLAAGRLEPLLLDFPDVPGAVHAVYPPGRHLSSKVRAFVDHLAARFGPDPYWDAPVERLRVRSSPEA